MPSITTSFIDLLLYIAPGFVVLYSLRIYFPILNKLFGPEGKAPPSIEALILLLLMTIAAGVVVAGMSTIFTRLVGILTRARHPRETRIEIYRHVLLQQHEKLALFYQHTRDTQAFGRMTTALLISILSMLWHHFSGEQQLGIPWVKFGIIVVFFILMAVATGLSQRTNWEIMEAFTTTLPATKQKEEGDRAANKPEGG